MRSIDHDFLKKLSVLLGRYFYDRDFLFPATTLYYGYAAVNCIHMFQLIVSILHHF